MIQELPFQKVQHEVGTLDAQPASQSGNILVLVTGKLLVDDGQSALMFSQTFQVRSSPRWMPLVASTTEMLEEHRLMGSWFRRDHLTTS